jgi:hypothetical protein
MRNIILTFKILLLGVFLSSTAFGQQILLPTQVQTGADFGTTILVPVDGASIGDVIVGSFDVQYDPAILTYVGVTNLAAVFAGAPNVDINSSASGVLQISCWDDLLSVFTFPEGKVFDIQFTYNGGFSSLNFANIAFMDDAEIEFSPSGTNGSVTGFADLTGSSGSWNTAGTWTGTLGTLTQPGPGHNVTINSGGDVTVGAAGRCNNLTIADGGHLTQTAALTVGGNLLVQSGGSYIPSGTLTVTGTKSMERAVTAANWGIVGQGYHLLSSPVAAQAITGNADFAPTGGGNDYDFYAWVESSQTWWNQKAHPGDFTTFTPGTGYLAAFQLTDTKSFGGTFNTANVVKTNLTKGVYVGSGWNLLGNPFSSAIQWNDGNWALTNIAAGAKVWNSGSGSYSDIAASGFIPACNGFMVQATVNTGSLTIPAVSRVHNNTAWYKSTDQRIYLMVRDVENNLAQESTIRFNEGASEGYDSEFDSQFLEGYAPLFYSMAGVDRVSTNTLPSLELNNAIPFSFVKNEGTNFSIELVEGIESNLVFIRDLKTGITYNLTENGNYTFSAEAGDVAERFEIFFGVTGIDTQNALNAAHVYSAKDMLYVTNVKGNTTMDILNLQGQVLNSYSFNSSGSEEFTVNLPTGVYLVRLHNSNTTKTVKVFIN